MNLLQSVHIWIKQNLKLKSACNGVVSELSFFWESEWQVLFDEKNHLCMFSCESVSCSSPLLMGSHSSSWFCPHIDLPQRNKHNNMQQAKSSFLKCTVSVEAWFCSVGPGTNHGPLHTLFKGFCDWRQRTNTFICASQTDARMREGHLLLTTRKPRQPTRAIKQLTLAESFNHCVPYEKKGSRWTAVTDAVTLHIVKYIENKHS